LSAAYYRWGVETDVFYSTDGVVINFHDENFLALTGNDLDISEASWEQVRNFTYLKQLGNKIYN